MCSQADDPSQHDPQAVAELTSSKDLRVGDNLAAGTSLTALEQAMGTLRNEAVTVMAGLRAPMTTPETPTPLDELRAIEDRYGNGFGDIDQAAEDVATLLALVDRLRQALALAEDRVAQWGDATADQRMWQRGARYVVEALRAALIDGAIPAMRYAARRLDAISGERKTADDLRADADKLERLAAATPDAPAPDGLLPGEPDPREPSCAYPGCGLPEFIHRQKMGHPFRAVLRAPVVGLDVERLGLSPEQTAILRKHLASRHQTVAEFFGDVLMEYGLGRATGKEYPPPVAAYHSEEAKP